MRPKGDERGVALVVTVVVLLMVTASLASYLTVATASRRAVGAELARERALYAAELVAAIAVQRFAHSDTISLTDEIAVEVPLASALVGGGSGTTTASRLRASARIRPLSAGSHLVEAEASGPDASRRIVLTVRRIPAVPPPSAAVALYAAPGAEGVGARFGGREFWISGFDETLAGLPGGAAALPAIAVRDEAAVDDLFDALSSSQYPRVVGDGSPPSIANAAGSSPYTALRMQDAVRALAERAHQVLEGNVTIRDWEVGSFGSAATPRIVVVQGDLTVRSQGQLLGAGVLIVDGDLEVHDDGYLHYDGLIVVRGRGQIELETRRPSWYRWFPAWWWEGSHLRGALVALPTAEGTSRSRLRIEDYVEIQRSEEALELARRAASHIRRVELQSWREGVR
ncbi:MAG: hypothetical protein KatS3mg102_0702 [Planctomycetota bacterium]|nr:MAG: hypothetical protein KatS3mg102_0702 [Planctomycetota bacterium]